MAPTFDFITSFSKWI